MYYYRLAETSGIRKALSLIVEFHSEKEFLITHHDLNN